MDFKEFLTDRDDYDAEVLESQTRVALFYLENAGLIEERDALPCYVTIELIKDLGTIQSSLTDSSHEAELIQHFRENGFVAIGQSWKVDIRELALMVQIAPRDVLGTIRSLVDQDFLSWTYCISFLFAGKFSKKLKGFQDCTLRVIQKWQQQPPIPEGTQFSVYGLMDAEVKEVKKCLWVLSVLGWVKSDVKDHGKVTVHLQKMQGSYTNWLQQIETKAREFFADVERIDQVIRSFYKQQGVKPEKSLQLEVSKLSAQLPSDDVFLLLEQMQKLKLVTLGQGVSDHANLYQVERVARSWGGDKVYEPLQKHYDQRRRRIYALQRILSMGEAKLTAHEVYHDICYRIMQSGDVDENEAMQLREAYQEFLKAEGDEKQEWEDLILKEYGTKYLDNLELQRVRAFRNYFLWSLEEFDRHYLQDINLSEPPSVNRLIQELNPEQLEVVTDDKSRAILVLAGPGVGKTRVIVYRIFYLVRSRGVAPEKILAIAYNRSAAAEIRSRLYEVLGPDARRIDALTFHALARKFVTSSLPQNVEDEDKHEWLLQEFSHYLDMENPGYQYILVDEFQDLNQSKYEIVMKLTNFMQESDEDDESQDSFIVAVGDDDQNIATFTGANVEYIQKFSEKFQINNTKYLLLNYRSGSDIIKLNNLFIEKNIPARYRLKDADHPIQPAKPEVQGHGQVVWGKYRHIYDAATWMVQKIQELLDTESIDPSEIAILAHRWNDLQEVQFALTNQKIKYQLYTSPDSSRPINTYLGCQLKTHLQALDPEELITEPIQRLENLAEQYSHQEIAWQALIDCLISYMTRVGETSLSAYQILEVLETSRFQTKEGIVLSTIHSSKGSEFKHVFILEESAALPTDKKDPVLERQGVPSRKIQEMTYTRRLYVGMTRAKSSLHILLKGGSFNIQVIPNLIREILKVEFSASEALIPATDQSERPDVVIDNIYAEKSDLFFSYDKIKTPRSQQAIENYGHSWGALTWQRHFILGKYRYLFYFNGCVVSASSNKFTETLDKLNDRGRIRAVEGYSIARVVEGLDVDDTQPASFHFVVLPKLTIEKPI